MSLHVVLTLFALVKDLFAGYKLNSTVSDKYFSHHVSGEFFKNLFMNIMCNIFLLNINYAAYVANVCPCNSIEICCLVFCCAT